MDSLQTQKEYNFLFDTFLHANIVDVLKGEVLSRVKNLGMKESITLDRGIPDPIPTSNIAYTGFGTYEVPSLSGSNMYRTYGLPPTRATWTPVVYNIQSYPCSIDITALDPDTYQFGVTPLTAIAASFTPGADFYWNDGFGGANVSTYSLPVDRTVYDPFVIVFNGSNLASIRDTAIIVDQGQSTQQVTNINWIPLSSIQIGPQDILNTVNAAITTSGYFDTNSKIEQVDNHYNFSMIQKILRGIPKGNSR
jgi:hypothetical protein